jgi:hypothetical protein
MDDQYNTTKTGETFQSCVSCLLQSDFQDEGAGETDVNWGLCELLHLFINYYNNTNRLSVDRQSAIRLYVMCLQLSRASDECFDTLPRLVHTPRSSARLPIDRSSRQLTYNILRRHCFC